MMLPLKVVGGASFGRYGKISLENTYNMMISDNALVAFPGYMVSKTMKGIQSRGIFKSVRHNILIRVIDNNVYIVNSVLNHTKVGELETASGEVYIVENASNQFAISDLSKIYIYTWGGTVVQVPVPVGVGAPAFVPGYIDYQDGYFICADRNSNSWRLSHIEDGLNWDALDPSTGLTYEGKFETKPDICQATVQFNRLLFVMADTGTEIWRDVGNRLFPYQRDNSLSIDFGIVSISTIATGFGLLVWLAKNEKSNPSIVFSSGGPPQSISTDGIDFLLSKIEVPEDSNAFIFQEDGHIIYQITFSTDNITLAYDFSEEKFYTLTNSQMDHHIAKQSVYFNNINYFISYNNADIYEFGTRLTTYDGFTIPRFRICPAIRKSDTHQFKIKRALLTMEQGVTNQLQKVGIAMSKNGGISFGNYVTNECNPQGYGANKMQFWKLGAANDVVIKFAFWSGNPTQPVRNENGLLNERFVIIDGQLEII